MKQSGFTLVEVLITSMIMVVVSSLVISSYISSLRMSRLALDEVRLQRESDRLLNKIIVPTIKSASKIYEAGSSYIHVESKNSQGVMFILYQQNPTQPPLLMQFIDDTAYKGQDYNPNGWQGDQTHRQDWNPEITILSDEVEEFYLEYFDTGFDINDPEASRLDEEPISSSSLLSLALVRITFALRSGDLVYKTYRWVEVRNITL